MIVRDDGSSLLLITQPDHAQLAGEIAAAMRSEPGLLGPERETILLATREHDNGWREIDADASVDPVTGRPYDFIKGPARLKHELWPRGIVRVARGNPLAGALIAEHALTVYSDRAGDAEWQAFFSQITAMREDLLRQIGIEAGPARDRFERDYRVVRLSDALSLTFCNGWTEVEETLGYRAELRGSTLFLSPDPFAGASVTLRVIARRIPARRYAHDGDLQAELARTVPEFLVGDARGATVPERTSRT